MHRSPLEALRERLQHFQVTGDTRYLTDPLAQAEAEDGRSAAFRVSDDGRMQMNAIGLQIVGIFYLWRGRVAAREEDVREAIEIFLVVRQVAPELVPEEIAPLVDQIATDPGRRLTWHLAEIGRRGNELFARYESTHDEAYLLGALEARRRAVELTPEPGRDRARRLSILGDTVFTLYQHAGGPEHLDEAIEVQREAVAVTPAGNEFLWLRHRRLGLALRARFELAGSDADLGAALESARAAHAAADPADVEFIAAVDTLGIVLQTRYDRHHDRIDLDEAVRIWQGFVANIAPDEAPRPRGLQKLGDALFRRFEALGDPSDLDKCVGLYADAIGLANDAEQRAGLMSDLCYLLRRRFEYGGELNDLLEAQRLGRLAVEVLAMPGEAAFLAYTNLIRADEAHYDRVGDLQSLDEAIAVYHDVLAATPVDAPEFADRTGDRLRLFEKRFEHTGDRDDARAVFQLVRLHLAGPHPDIGQVAENLLRLGAFLDRHMEDRFGIRPAGLGPDLDRARFNLRARNGGAPDDRETLDELVALAREAIARREAEDDDFEVCGSALAVALNVRCRTFGSAADAAESIDLMRAVVAHADNGDDQRSRYLATLGDTQLVSFLTHESDIDLDSAILSYEEALHHAPPTAEDRGRYLPKLTHALQVRFESRRDPGDLERVIGVVREALDFDLPSPDSRAVNLRHLARILMWRFDLTLDLEDLDRAVAAAREAVTIGAHSELASADLLTGLAEACFTRFQQTGRIGDLDAAIAAGADAMAQFPAGHRRRSAQLHNQALRLYARASRNGDTTDLDRAVAGLREVTASPGIDNPSHAMDLYSLGVVLRARYQRLGDEADLWASVDAQRASFAATSAEPVMRSVAASGLANVLHLVYERTGDRQALDEGITLAAGAEPEFPRQGTLFSTLCSTHSWLLRQRIELTADPSDVEEILRVSRMMLDAAHPGEDNYALYLRNRAVALFTAFGVLGERTLLDEAVTTAIEAVESTQADDARRAEWSATAGRLLYVRYEAFDDRADLEAALDHWRQAAQDSIGSPDMRVQSSYHAGRAMLVDGDPAAALVGYELAVRILPTVAWRGKRSAARSESLSEWTGLASEAASCAILAGKPALAVELLEQGRSVMWTQALHLRSDLSELALEHSDLAARLSAVRAELDASWAADGPATARAADGRAAEPPAWQEIGERQRLLAHEWDDLVGRVRNIAGFENFQQPTPYAALKQAAEDGPVVVVNASAFGCHALIVRAADAGPEVVPLPDVSDEDVSDAVAVLLTAVRIRGDAGASFLDRERARHLLHDILDWLWDTVAIPVLARIDGAGGAEPPRLWWCPTGLLSLLPLHAAGRHPRHLTTEASGPCVHDLVVSSYTPTLAALLRSREPRPARSPGKLLVVGMPHTPSHADLPAVTAELAGLASRAARNTEMVRLVGPDASRSAVLTELRRCDRVHLACHAYQDHADPAASGFALQDGSLALAEIATLDLPTAELAYLSACETATGTPRLADEALHLAAAVQLVGYRQVVAASWTIADSSAAAVAEAFYADPAALGYVVRTSAATALHRAVRALRDADPTDPARWASYVHFGS